MAPDPPSGAPALADLVISEELNYGPFVGLNIWDAGTALAKFLPWWEAQGHRLQDRVALELGAGTGVTGLTLAALGATVTLTDSEECVLRLIQRNIDENGLGAQASPRRLDWSDPATYLTKPVDLVVAADVVYDVQVERDLARAMAAHVPMGSDVEVLFANKKRQKLSTGHELFVLLSSLGFHIERLENAAGQPLGSDKGKATSTFGDGRFVALPRDGEAAAAAVVNAWFDSNGEAVVQIFRMKRPRCDYFVIGSWTDWKKWGDMRCRVGSPTCRRSVPVRAGRVEEFQIGIDKDWNRVFYPVQTAGGEVESGGPGVAHGVNWSVQVPEGVEWCEVCVDTNATPRHRVGWTLLEGPPIWQVIEGLGKGGVVVRRTRKLTSLEMGKLSEGSVVEEQELHGNRLCYSRILQGYGPAKGWVSLDFKGRALLKRVSDPG